MTCEGQKPFGTLPGEAEILNLIQFLHLEGVNSDDIAVALNDSPPKPSRSGKPWRGSVIRRILAREVNK